MSPKVAVYVRAADARIIETIEGHDIQLFVRSVVRDAITAWHDERAKAVGARPMPVAWANHAERLGEETPDAV